MKTAILALALCAVLTVANAQSNCKSYSRGANFQCDIPQGICCQKGLDCVGMVCKVPSTPAPAPTPTAPTNCKSYARGANFQCDIPQGICCQKGLDCVGMVCKVPAGRRMKA